ncbi:MAG: hypothetical protein WDZ79_01195 [Candidatus Paceibacterota bacterium]
MGEIERRVKKRGRITKLQKAILGSVALAGGISVVVVAPNAVQALKFIAPGIFKNKKRSDAVGRSLERLKEKGLLREQRRGDKMWLEVTSDGRGLTSLAYSGVLRPKQQKRWDGKWRILMFDVAEKQRVQRNKLRRTLVSFGFVQLQKSAWVYPYPCDDLVQLLKRDLYITKSAVYIVAEEIERDTDLRSHFGLKKQKN